MKISPEDRFETKIRLEGTHLIFIGHLDRDGYGIFYYKGKNIRAHKYSWESIYGPVPEGLQLDHLCRIRNCVNVKHLEPVTAKINIGRGNTGRTKRTPKMHCINGHEFTIENTYIYQTPQRVLRVCKICRRRRGRDFDRINRPHRFRNSAIDLGGIETQNS